MSMFLREKNETFFVSFCLINDKINNRSLICLFLFSGGKYAVCKLAFTKKRSVQLAQTVFFHKNADKIEQGILSNLCGSLFGLFAQLFQFLFDRFVDCRLRLALFAKAHTDNDVNDQVQKEEADAE